MMRHSLMFTIALLLASAGHSDVVTPIAGGTLLLVADQGRLRAIETKASRVVWERDGVATPALVIASADGSLAAVLDSIADRVMLIRTADGETRTFSVPATPVSAAFSRDRLFVLCRDGRQIVAISWSGTMISADAPIDSSHIMARADSLLVYSRGEGRVEIRDNRDLSLRRSAVLEPFGSDFEIDRKFGYIVAPSEGVIVIFDARELTIVERLRIGSAPVDLAIDARELPTSAGTLAIADPASKRLWRSERTQSVTAAAARGFVRGLMGLGLYHPRSVEFPFGIDRVMIAGGRTVAYDSASRTLYSVQGSRIKKLRAQLAPAEFALAGDEILIWNRDLQRVERITSQAPTSRAGGD